MQLDSYLARIVERELPESGVSVRRPSALRAWLAAYAAATASDPALAARMVGVGRAGLLRGEGRRAAVAPATGTWLRALFESLVAQSVRVYAGAADATVGHLRTKGTEHEVDLIVEGADRAVVAIEVKLRRDGIAVVPLGLLGP